MNRLAVVLAADSATTVSHYTDEGRQERYFKGANKIFQLSDHHPVGAMIFSSANILDVPWELVIKEFRKSLGRKSFNDLQGYADELFTFMENSPAMFTEQMKRENIDNSVKGQFLGLVMEANRAAIGVIEGSEDKGDTAKDSTQKAEFKKLIDALKNKHKKASLPSYVKDGCAQEFKENFYEIALEAIEPFKEVLPSHFFRSIKSVVEVILDEIALDCKKLLGDTGIVIAGYGDKHIFPSMMQFTSCGFLGNRHIVESSKPVQIDGETPAHLQAFAQTSMTDTFTIGLSGDVYTNVKIATRTNLEEFAKELAAKLGRDIKSIDELDKMISKTQDKVGIEVLKNSRSEHGEPLRRVLSVLPIEEMAELAETLINLQSLKEKVTKPSETVGGPVDVAVITRHEGLVWIKRKHYFTGELNSRFALRQADQLQLP